MARLYIAKKLISWLKDFLTSVPFVLDRLTRHQLDIFYIAYLLHTNTIALL